MSLCVSALANNDGILSKAVEVKFTPWQVDHSMDDGDACMDDFSLSRLVRTGSSMPMISPTAWSVRRHWDLMKEERN